ncbi:MAG TPA: type II secretion system protein [Terriglobia bacterium]|nr:type II secretion system protein [Terriglobia bacterium]
MKMLLSTKPLICPFRSRSAGKQVISAEDELRGNGVREDIPGFALFLVMVAAAVILISLTAALPSIYQEGRREREEELIFRGTEYARAIASFHQKFQRWPTSIQDLTRVTNGFRFLRREYADPMTPDGKWRFIHANAQGVLLDSKTQGPPPGGMGQPGAAQGAWGFAGSSGPSGMSGGGFGQQGMGGSGSGQQGMGGSGFDQQGTGGSGFSQQGMGGSGFGQQSMGGSGFGQSTGGFSSDSDSAAGASNPQQNSGFTMGTSQGGGTFIVGVASTSHKQSIRTYNQKTHYDEWEFVGIDMGALGIATSIPGLPQGVGGQPGQGNQPSGFGQPSQGNQPSGFGQPSQGSGFGQPGQNPGTSSPSGGSSFSPQ